MQNRTPYLLALYLISFRSFAVIGEESAILSGILSQQIQAVAGISEIITNGKKTFKEIEDLKDAHEKIETTRLKAERAYIYAQQLGRFGQERERIKTLVEVNNNLQDAKLMVDNRHDLTFGAEILKFSSKEINAEAKNNLEKSRLDEGLIQNLKSSASKSNKTGTSTQTSAAANVESSRQLYELNQKMQTMMLHQSIKNMALAYDIERKNYDTFLLKKRWGLVPNITYDEYRKIISTKKNSENRRGKNEKLP